MTPPAPGQQEMSPAHTPGPWAFCGPYEMGAFMDEGYLITTGYDVHPPEPEVGVFDGREPLHGPKWGFKLEDARLIAAAPELLALARKVAAHYANTSSALGAEAAALIAKIAA